MECCGSTQLFVRRRRIEGNRELLVANEKLRRAAALHMTYLDAEHAPAAHEFPDWPHGWYVAARSDEFTRAPLSLELFGRRLVGFRTRAGRPVIMDARCWHLGANLAQGTVCDDQIVCAFHGWRYGADGACALIRKK